MPKQSRRYNEAAKLVNRDTLYQEFITALRIHTDTDLAPTEA